MTESLSDKPLFEPLSKRFALQLRNVSVQRDDKCLLQDINLELCEQRVALIGANGSGKTTLSKLFNGLIAPSTGEVLLDGKNIQNDLPWARQKIGYLFQHAEHQLILPTVLEDVGFTLQNQAKKMFKNQLKSRFKNPANDQLNDWHYSPVGIEEKVQALLASYQLEHLQQQSVYQLSGGEQQLIAILGVLIAAPQWLIFDEPTALLDLRQQRRLKQWIADLPQQVLVITHDLDWLAEFDRVVVIDQARVVFDGEPTVARAHYVQLMC